MVRRPRKAPRIVTATDGRTWVLRRTIRWRRDVPTEDRDEYEHDVGSNGTPLVLGFLALFWAVVIWMGFVGEVHIPGYFWFAPLVAAMAFVTWWVLTLPWTMTAECADPPVESWVGIVRGRGNARAELRAVERSLRTRGIPGRDGGLLRPLTDDRPTKILQWPATMAGDEE